jgi:hypothetical protein
MAFALQTLTQGPQRLMERNKPNTKELLTSSALIRFAFHVSDISVVNLPKKVTLNSVDHGMTPPAHQLAPSTYPIR